MYMKCVFGKENPPLTIDVYLDYHKDMDDATSESHFCTVLAVWNLSWSYSSLPLGYPRRTVPGRLV